MTVDNYNGSTLERTASIKIKGCEFHLYVRWNCNKRGEYYYDGAHLQFAHGECLFEYKNTLFLRPANCEHDGAIMSFENESLISFCNKHFMYANKCDFSDDITLIGWLESKMHL